MSKRTLEQAFNAVFHEKESFNDFCAMNHSQEVLSFSANSRDLFHPSPKLKKYLRFIDKVILRYLERDDVVVHSYIKGKSALTAVEAHAGSSHFFMTDIKAFFSNITDVDVREILTRNEGNVPISDIKEHISLLVEMMTWQGSLPVGFPTSPQLSNAFLLRFDQKLHRYCEGRGYTYTRYSDDIVISAKSFDGFEHLSETIQLLLNTAVSPLLRLSDDKTRYTHTGNKVKILGLVVTQGGKVTIDSKYKRQLETLLHFYVTDRERFGRVVDETLAGKEHSLFGLLHYARSIDPSYLEKLQRKYGAYALRSLMEDKWHG
ncbi:reverse transcriptase domain-containing protein [Endozoicomonas numazuensis]|uniref:reverse transcriptase domain-containing protein n=1 Tax=Endozoicomonas numazuensis TaxID=1137799 RepID=UPI0012691D3D|nr:reverse transcriptase domain-containing protein [Endozoicomonas numazuensis]